MTSKRIKVSALNKKVKLSRRKGEGGNNEFRPLHCNELHLATDEVSAANVTDVTSIDFQLNGSGDDVYDFSVLDMSEPHNDIRRVWYVLWAEGGDSVPVSGAGTLTVVVSTTEGDAEGHEDDVVSEGP